MFFFFRDGFLLSSAPYKIHFAHGGVQVYNVRIPVLRRLCDVRGLLADMLAGTRVFWLAPGLFVAAQLAAFAWTGGEESLDLEQPAPGAPVFGAGLGFQVAQQLVPDLSPPWEGKPLPK